MTKVTLLAPQITEKSSMLLADGKYVFFVTLDANSIEVRRAIEKRYNVDVKKVNMVKVPSKKRRRGRIVGQTSRRKKAIITLKKGQEILELKEIF